jgi:hypothetical protein
MYGQVRARSYLHNGMLGDTARRFFALLDKLNSETGWVRASDGLWIALGGCKTPKAPDDCSDYLMTCVLQ